MGKLIQRVFVLTFILCLMGGVVWLALGHANLSALSGWQDKLPQLSHLSGMWQMNKQSQTPALHEQSNLTQVTVYTVPEASETHRIRLVGLVQPIEYPAIVAPNGGIVSKVFVEEGQFIAKGKPILRLDTRRLRNTYNNLQIQLSMAQVQEQLTATEEIPDPFSGEEETLQTSQSMTQTGEQITQSIQQTSTALKPSLPAELNIPAQLAPKQDQPTGPAPTLSKTQRLLARLKQVKAQLAAQTILMPQSGKLKGLSLQPHDIVSAGDTLALVDKPLPPVVEIGFPLDLLSQIQPDQSALVKITTGNGTMQLHAKLLAPPSSPTPGSKVAWGKVQLNPGHYGQALQGGETVDVYLELPGSGSLYIPSMAIQHKNGYASVYILSSVGGKARVLERAVVVGKTSPEETEIIEGLSPGEQIVINSSASLQHNQRVTVNSEQSNDDEPSAF